MGEDSVLELESDVNSREDALKASRRTQLNRLALDTK
jgi:hypothetical protein